MFMFPISMWFFGGEKSPNNQKYRFPNMSDKALVQKAFQN